MNKQTANRQEKVTNEFRDILQVLDQEVSLHLASPAHIRGSVWAARKTILQAHNRLTIMVLRGQQRRLSLRGETDAIWTHANASAVSRGHEPFGSYALTFVWRALMEDAFAVCKLAGAFVHKLPRPVDETCVSTLYIMQTGEVVAQQFFGVTRVFDTIDECLAFYACNEDVEDFAVSMKPRLERFKAQMRANSPTVVFSDWKPSRVQYAVAAE